MIAQTVLRTSDLETSSSQSVQYGAEGHWHAGVHTSSRVTLGYCCSLCVSWRLRLEGGAETGAALMSERLLPSTDKLCGHETGDWSLTGCCELGRCSSCPSSGAHHLSELWQRCCSSSETWAPVSMCCMVLTKPGVAAVKELWACSGVPRITWSCPSPDALQHCSCIQQQDNTVGTTKQAASAVLVPISCQGQMGQLASSMRLQGATKGCVACFCSFAQAASHTAAGPDST